MEFIGWMCFLTGAYMAYEAVQGVRANRVSAFDITVAFVLVLLGFYLV